VVGGISSTGTVTLSGPAPTSGVVITLVSNKTDAVVPATVTVPGGATTVKFTVTTVAVTTQVTATISAKLATVTKSANLIIAK